MAFLSYEYRMKISYEEEISKCYYTIKSIPADDYRQKGMSYEISIAPPVRYAEGMDSFGNRQIYGCENIPHDVFEYGIKGMVETKEGNHCDRISENRLGMYKYPYGKCVPGEKILAFAKEIECDVVNMETTEEKCRCLMEKLSKKLTYEKGCTGVDTSAEEAFGLGKGVCQDFAHIYICLLKIFGIPARYVCGLIVGEGESHAWVEAACDGFFIGVDPTYNKEIDENYIKLGVGRDAMDCTINRGVMWGGGKQQQEISVLVERLY